MENDKGREPAAKIEHDLDTDTYIIRIRALGGKPVTAVVGPQVLEDLEAELDRVNAGMSA